MIMRYEWLHFWKTWELKLKTIFGEPDNPNPDTVKIDGYEWKPSNSLDRFNDPAFLENIEKL